MSEPERDPPASPDEEPPPTVRRWVLGDQAIGAGLIVLMVSLFLPWFRVTGRVAVVGVLGQVTPDGPRAHSYLWVVMVLALIGLAVLIGRDAIRQAPGNLPSPGQMLVGVSFAAFALTVLAVLSKPPAVTIHPALLQGSVERISSAWSYGGFVAVAAAGVAVAVAFITSGPQYEASRAAHAGGPATG